MGETVDALKLKIKEQGGSTAGIHTIPQAIKRLDVGGGGSESDISIKYEDETIKVTTKKG